jgi:hypothetical protein
LHSGNVRTEGSGKLFGVDVFLQEGEDLVEELLLMEVVELQDGVHLVNDQVLMDKSRELVHNCSNEALVVFHANVDVIAGDHLLLVVHAHVELGSNTTDPDAFHGVTGVGVVSHETIAFFVLLDTSGLNSCESR